MEVTKHDFAKQEYRITRDLQKSCFVGFDAEYTAILSGELFKHSLFDTNEQRYDKIKTQVGKMVMTQIGLTMFQYDRDHDTYEATGYTFHLCPQVLGDIDQSFVFQASTLRFLCRHKFNFNKFIYEGLPYLSKIEIAHLQHHMKEKTLFNTLLQSMEIEDEKQLQNYCDKVSKWLRTSEEDTFYIDVESPVMRYIVHNEVRVRFPNVLTTDSLGNSNKVLIYRSKSIEGATCASAEDLEQNLLTEISGFSQIISLLEVCQKPIVGHNMFLDLVLLHNQFIGPLPQKYITFKKNIHDVFPNIYDTKYISYEMGKRLTFDEVWKSNALQDLYEFFAEAKCKKLQRGVNLIRLCVPFDVKQTYHEAGWDSYCSAYCLIRLGHWIACENSGKYRPVGPTEKLSALKPFANKINVIRSAVPYMNIVGDDPPTHRPDLLKIMTLKEKSINVGQVASTLAGLGSIDVKPYGRRTALISAQSQHTAEKILNQFKDSRDYRVTVYVHSMVGRMAMWGSALITGSLVLFLLHKGVN